MKLISAEVRKFRNIIDSNPVDIDDHVTCLVGKNESGKTAFLHALYMLNPVRQNVKFIVEENYPAWLEKRERMQGKDLSAQRPISADFVLDQQEVSIINDMFGDKVLKSKTLRLEKNYSGTLYYSFDLDEKKYLKNVLEGLNFSKETRTSLSNCASIAELKEYLTNYESNDETPEKEVESITSLKSRLESQLGENNSIATAAFKEIEPFIPKFIYFDEYSSLPYTVKIKEVLQANEDNLDNDLLTARSLLRMAAADDEYLLNPNYERRKRELENVANALTQDVLNYWSQNPELRVNPDITQTTVNQPNGQTAVIDELKIRIWDNKHFLSLPFDEHSTGFQWFFSFLAAFSEFEYSNEPIIILLDEPGLGLHGKAQADFLRFIEERLATKRQVVYSTHSPFMIQPDKLERARVVEEKSIDEGAKITKDVLTTDPDTLFPLQGALGYDLTQHLFISKHNLVLEGTSDYTYIFIISDYLKSKDRKFLVDDWTLVPVGGADLIPTFVALLGIHLDITIVIDARKEGNQKLSNLANKGYLKSKRIISLNKIVPLKLADIEDLFAPQDYLDLYNDAFSTKHKLEDLEGNDQIVTKISRLEGIRRFDHGKPADCFLRNRDKYLPNLSEATLNNFEKLFDHVNQTFKK